MHYTTVQTRRRGCGYRNPGGLYMVAPGAVRPCGLLPIPLDRCPTCGGGIKQTRSFQWINPQPLATPRHAATCHFGGGSCYRCWELWGEKCGLLWIGAAYYETPEAWLDEAVQQGISRRISAVPNDFKIGEHWVLAAHPKAIRELCQACAGSGGLGDHLHLGPRCEACNGSGTAGYKPGIFAAWRPTAIERVLSPEEQYLLDEYADMAAVDEETAGKWVDDLLPQYRKLWDALERLVKKGVQLVRDEKVDQPRDTVA